LVQGWSCWYHARINDCIPGVDHGPKERIELKQATSPDRRIRRTRQAIRHALQRLLQTRQLEQITIRDIAAEADVAYTTFFRHYPTKETLLTDLADDEIARLLDLCFPILNASDTYVASLALCRYVEENDLLWSALLIGGAAGAIRSAFIKRTLEHSMHWPPVLEWLPADIGLTLIVGMIIELLSWWLRQDQRDSAERMATILDKLLISTLVKPGES
jgi:AcrR family transcriptional regulator